MLLAIDVFQKHIDEEALPTCNHYEKFMRVRAWIRGKDTSRIPLVDLKLAPHRVLLSCEWFPLERKAVPISTPEYSDVFDLDIPAARSLSLGLGQRGGVDVTSMTTSRKLYDPAFLLPLLQNASEIIKLLRKTR